MKSRLAEAVYIGVLLLIVVLLFTIVDHFIHGLSDAWSVPDYYFRNKVPFGFFWLIVGFFLARKVENIWLKALIAAGIVAVILQTRYFLEGYALDFVLIFALFHFLILYVLLVGMYWILEKQKLSALTIKNE